MWVSTNPGSRNPGLWSCTVPDSYSDGISARSPQNTIRPPSSSTRAPSGIDTRAAAASVTFGVPAMWKMCRDGCAWPCDELPSSVTDHAFCNDFGGWTLPSRVAPVRPCRTHDEITARTYNATDQTRIAAEQTKRPRQPPSAECYCKGVRSSTNRRMTLSQPNDSRSSAAAAREVSGRSRSMSRSPLLPRTSSRRRQSTYP